MSIEPVYQDAPRTAPIEPRPVRLIAAGRTVIALAGAILLLSSSAAAACNLPIRVVGPIDVQRTELRRPVAVSSTHAAWHLDQSWTSVEPQLVQNVRTRRSGMHRSVAFSRQRALSIDALPPDTYGWTYVDDHDPRTPTCTMVGQREWEAPTVRIIESPRAVRILAASRRTPGDTAGCIIGPRTDGLPCPNLTTTIIRLRAPLGARQLQFETFAP